MKTKIAFETSLNYITRYKRAGGVMINHVLIRLPAAAVLFPIACTRAENAFLEILSVVKKCVFRQ